MATQKEVGSTTIQRNGVGFNNLLPKEVSHAQVSIVLITPEEVDEAVKKTMDWHPPGQ